MNGDFIFWLKNNSRLYKNTNHGKHYTLSKYERND